MKNKIQIYTNHFLFSLGITALFLFIDYAEKFPLSLSAEFDSFENIGRNLWAINEYSSLAIGVYVFMVWMLYLSLKNVKAVFQEIIVPLAIVIFTLLTGTYGFLQTGCYNFGDAFFAAANLLTLNTSVFQSFLAQNADKVNFWIENARLMGGLFLTYAFILALSLATGKENISRIRFRIFRELNLISFKIFNKKTPFYVVIGDGEKAVSLALNLEKKGQRVAFLHQGFGEYTENILEEKKIWYLKGNASSKTGLEKTYFHLAEKVYVLNDSDEENFRTIQEMEDILKHDKNTAKPEWFVHLTDLRKKSLLTSFVKPRYIQTFDINQNIARKLIKENSINRFEDGSTIAQVVIVGFGHLAEAIVMQCLRIGHFTGERHLQIKVYFTEKDQANVSHFKKSHPEIFKNQGVFGTDKLAQEAQHYTFFQHAETLIDFEELSLPESELVNPNFSLYSLVIPINCVSLYVCLDAGTDNAAFLGTVLPRMAWQKTQQNGEVKVYCQYNFPDEEEKEVVKKKLNELTSNQVEVLCFGSLLEECTDGNIDNVKLDKLAKQIALMYDKVHAVNDEQSKTTALQELKNWDLKGLVEKWHEIVEIERESNRQAADHAWVKFREMGKDPFSSTNDLTQFCTDDELSTLSKLEHRRWNAEKLLLGWLPTDDKKNWKTNKSDLKKQKLHLFLIPYDKLPEEEKMKDYTQVLGLPFFMREL